jgi:RNA polymerase sigma-70 factor (ECF subfamily)
MARPSIICSELPRAPMANTREGIGLDQKTLEALYVKLEGPIHNVVYRWLWDTAEARDVTQEAFLNVWKARERVDLATVEPLLYRTALNLASNRRRSRRIWQWLGLDAASAEPLRTMSTEDAIDREKQRILVRKAIDALPERLRQVVMLAEYSELSYEEIAAALEIPIGTVGSRRSAAMRELAAKLDGILDLES